MAVLAGSLAASLQAADEASKAPGAAVVQAVSAAPTLGERLKAVDKQLKEKKFDEAEKELLALEKEKAGNEQELFPVYRKLMGLYAAKGEGAKFEEWGNKTLALQKVLPQQRIEILSAMENSTDNGSQYYGYYSELLPENTIKKMAEKNLAYNEELARLMPSNAGSRIVLGKLYVDRGAADKAAVEFAAALALSNLSPMQQGEALIGQASVALLKKDRAGAIKYCEEVLARKLKTNGRNSIDPSWQARVALDVLRDAPEVDSMKLPWYTGAKVFPTAQQAKYTDEYVTFTAAKLVLGKGMQMEDPRIKLLKTKFDRFGIKLDDSASFAIKINVEAEPKAPEKAEGYAISITKNGAVINSHDAAGTTWGVVSLLQLFNLEKAGVPKLRIAEVVDYPDTNYRGCLANMSLEAALFSKMNVVIEDGMQLVFKNSCVPRTPLMREVCKRRLETFDAFGLRLYEEIPQYTMYPKLPLSNERTFDLHVKLFNEIADAKGHGYFPYDDGRFPVPQVDLDKFGSAASMDAKYLTRLYKEVKKNHPDFHMIFCPPFYWGPESESSYPEPREPYLKSLGDYLDPEIEVFWTGPRVKGYQKSPDQVKWFSDLIKRKPVIFQNATGRHNLWSYMTDEMPEWKTWHYEGFLDKDLTGYLKNGGEIPQVITLADCLWNIKGYDSAASIRNAVAMFYGKEMFDIIDPATKAMTKLDKYPYMQVRPGAAEEAEEIAKLSVIANEAWAKGLEYNRYALEGWGGQLGSVVGGSKNLAELAKTAPDIKKTYGKQIDATREDAAKEIGINPAKGDIFRSPAELIGGDLTEYGTRCPKRFANCVRGKLSGISTLTTGFECDPFPPAGAYELYVSAQDDDKEKEVNIRISVNGKSIFEGPSGFVRYGWSQRKFTIPFEAMKRGNQLVIECIDEGANVRSGPPWFMVNYVVIKKAVQ